MVRSTDTKSSRHLWFTAAAFLFAVGAGGNLHTIYDQGPTAMRVAYVAVGIILALACAYVAINACLARRRACDELRTVRAEGMAQATKDLVGADKFVVTHRDEAVTDVQLVRFPDGFTGLLADLHYEIYDLHYAVRPTASITGVNAALMRVLDAADVPNRSLRRPRGIYPKP